MFSKEWPFYAKLTSFLILKCPVCENKWEFQAISLRSNLIWKCRRCGNQDLILNTISSTMENQTTN